MNLSARHLKNRLLYFIRHFYHQVSPHHPNVPKGAFVSVRAKIEGFGENIHLSPGCRIREYAWLNCLDEKSSIHIGKGTLIMPYAKLVTGFSGRIVLGEFCSVHSFDVLYGFTGGLEFGNGVRIGTGATFISSNHEFDDLSLPMSEQGFSSKGVRIGDETWIGAGAIITDGVTIGPRAVIGAGSVVTRDVPADAVCVGVPGRVVRKRGERL